MAHSLVVGRGMYSWLQPQDHNFAKKSVPQLRVCAGLPLRAQ